MHEYVVRGNTTTFNVIYVCVHVLICINLSDQVFLLSQIENTKVQALKCYIFRYVCVVCVCTYVSM